MFDAFLTADGMATLATLSVLEIILGIDNLVFIAILVARLEPDQQPAARRLGLGLAMITRCLLLAGMSFLAHLTKPTGLIVPFSGHALSYRDVVLLGGGFFLLYKATKEIHEKLEEEDDEMAPPAHASFAKIIFQIVLIDIIFSLDSVITAVGIADDLSIMIAAVILAVMVMIIFAGPISNFINRHPSIKMLALSFLILIGCMLVSEGTGHHINKGYIYFAMFFSLTVESLNLITKKKKRAKRDADRQALSS
jgi:predicted tellurium resistance membrane protein TerC